MIITVLHIKRSYWKYSGNHLEFCSHAEHFMLAGRSLPTEGDATEVQGGDGNGRLLSFIAVPQ